MTLMQRRRALMVQQEPSFEILDGAELAWEKGAISNTGTLNNSEYVIRTSAYLQMSGKALTYLGPTKNTNNVAYFLFLVQYGASKNFLSRDYLLNSSGQVIRTSLNPDTRFVKLAFGHSASTAASTKVSEGELVQIRMENS